MPVIKLDKPPVHSQRAVARGQAQHEIRLLFPGSEDERGHFITDSIVITFNNYLHGATSSISFLKAPRTSLALALVLASTRIRMMGSVLEGLT